MTESKSDITGLLLAWRDGDEEALEELSQRLDSELRRLAHRCLRGERAEPRMDTTALINETYVRLMEGENVSWRNRTHFFALAARLMRRILVDHARMRRSLKRGQGATHLPLEESAIVSGEKAPEILALDDALQSLEKLDPRKSRVVELRYFGGLSVEETAEVLEVSAGTVMRDWRMARAWLRRELAGDSAQ